MATGGEFAPLFFSLFLVFLLLVNNSQRGKKGKHYVCS